MAEDQWQGKRSASGMLRDHIKSLTDPTSVLVNMLRGEIAKPSHLALTKLYTVEQLEEAIRRKQQEADCGCSYLDRKRKWQAP